jgi:UDP-N-acetylmuramate dehydrogenase
MATAPQNRILDLPEVRGTYTQGKALADITWFRVGGPAEILFMPSDVADLQNFLVNVSPDIPLTLLGAGSNVLVRDKGIAGVVIRLGRGFADIRYHENGNITAGAAALDVAVARFALDKGRTGLEFLRGIPGSIGGALAMNAGAYGGETKDNLLSVQALNWSGERIEMTRDQMDMRYRENKSAKDYIFLSAVFSTQAGDVADISARMEAISGSRETSQPIKSRTGGSTFKNPGGTNPEGPKAWKLIDAAGMRGQRIGGAQISELHCNFLINHGEATAAEIEALGEMVRKRVHETAGIELQWEIKRLGDPA